MVSKADTDSLLGKLQSYGETGRASRIDSQERVNEEINRQVSSLTGATQAVLRHQRQGPDWETVYRIPATGNANNYGGTTPPGVYTMKHDLDFTPSQWIVVRRSNGRSATYPPVSVTSWGNVRVISSNGRELVFQFDQAAIDERAIFHLCLFRDEFIPLGDG